MHAGRWPRFSPGSTPRFGRTRGGRAAKDALEKARFRSRRRRTGRQPSPDPNRFRRPRSARALISQAGRSGVGTGLDLTWASFQRRRDRKAGMRNDRSGARVENGFAEFLAARIRAKRGPERRAVGSGPPKVIMDGGDRHAVGTTELLGEPADPVGIHLERFGREHLLAAESLRKLRNGP